MHAGDPAVKVSIIFNRKSQLQLTICQDFMPKLKAHILPWIKALLLQETVLDPAQTSQAGLSTKVSDANSQKQDSVLFVNDHMYHHHLAHFNYTTYDGGGHKMSPTLAPSTATSCSSPTLVTSTA
jgi:hypothetical protein